MVHDNPPKDVPGSLNRTLADTKETLDSIVFDIITKISEAYLDGYRYGYAAFSHSYRESSKKEK